MNPTEIRAVLERNGLRLSRSRGQNLLVEASQAERLVRLAGVEPGDTVIEIGTGLGTLTRPLARRARRVVSIEIDAGLVRALRGEALLPDNVELVHADALRFDLAARLERERPPLRLVANLPYSVASPLLRRLLELRLRLVDWSVMLQKELADRLLAPCGGGDYGPLTVLHQLCARMRAELELHPRCFFPAPDVHSRFIRITPRADAPLGPGELTRVETVVRGAFQQRRKTLANALRAAGFDDPGPALRRAEIDARLRPERIRPESWLALARALESLTADAGRAK